TLVTATDNCTGPIVITFVNDNVVLTGCTEVTTRTYMATDACGNSATCTQTITRTVDVTPPTITCPAAVVLGCNATVPAPNITLVTATDNCTGTITITFVNDNVVLTGCTEVTTRTYMATDACGNTAACTQTITRTVDITAPTITCPAAVVLGCNATVPAPNITLVTATDNCTGTITITFVNDNVVLTGCTEVTTR